MIKAAVFGVVKNDKPDINERYFKHIHQCSAQTMEAYPYDPQEVVAECSCLVACGGGDMDPKFYNQTPWTAGTSYETELDRYELKLIRSFVNAGKPVLGICKGMQSINIALGGTLIQDIPSMLGLCHSNCSGKECTHEIKISPRSDLYRAMGLRAIVNSYHHQCVHVLGDSLVAAAASHDGIIEAIESEKYPVLGVQWHPERMTGNAVFKHFFETYLHK